MIGWRLDTLGLLLLELVEELLGEDEGVIELLALGLEVLLAGLVESRALLLLEELLLPRLRVGLVLQAEELRFGIDALLIHYYNTARIRGNMKICFDQESNLCWILLGIACLPLMHSLIGYLQHRYQASTFRIQL